MFLADTRTRGWPLLGALLRAANAQKIPPFDERVGCDAESALAAKDGGIVSWEPQGRDHEG